MGESITCTECGAPLTGRQTAVCSKDCKIKRDARLMDPARRKEIRTGIRQRRKAQMIHTCLVCAQPFGSTIHRSDPRAPKYCSKVCHGLALSERNKGKGPGGYHPLKPKKIPRPIVNVVGRCGRCGAWFTRRTRRPDLVTRWCSLRCSSGARAEKREALKRSTASIGSETIKRFDIFERDRWVCQLCRKKIDRSAKVPHPKSPVLDHVLPLAVGGSHTPANVQCAHFICNSTKRANVFGQGEQLRLLG